MKEKINYYAVKAVSVVVFLYSCLLVFGTAYTFVNYIAGGVQTLLGPGHANLYSGLLFVGILFIIDGLFGLFGSIGLFFFKRLGYYLVIVGIIFDWMISFSQNGGPMMHWLELTIATVILVYLIIVRKSIGSLREQNPSAGNKAIKIILIILVIILIAFTIFLSMQTSSLKQQGEIPTVETQATPSGEEVKVMTSNLGNTVSAPLSVPVASVSSKASEIAGFRVYCPSFIPREFTRDMTIANIMSSKTLADCSVQDSTPTSTSPEIMILERPIIQGEENTILKAADSLSSKQDVDINGDKGFTGTWTTDAIINVVIYTSKENTAIQIQSKDFNLDLLLKVARSMQ